MVMPCESVGKSSLKLYMRLCLCTKVCNMVEKPQKILAIFILWSCFLIAGSYPVKRAVIKCVGGRKTCDGDLKEHCWDRDYNHAVEGCLKPIMCEKGTYSWYKGSPPEIQPTCLPCEEGMFNDLECSSDKLSCVDACWPIYECSDKGLILYRKGNRTHDSVCKCNLEKGYHGGKANYTCQVNNCHCQQGNCPSGKQLNETGNCVPCPPGTHKPIESSYPCTHRFPYLTNKAEPNTRRTSQTEPTTTPDNETMGNNTWTWIPGIILFLVLALAGE
ncbi:NF-X1-type zinc finger protein NFXL1-like [Liolophura sinensis]|uniref:NF-X1-type zinc finger protein NFXL1-like n=1 Tax=Liolophura sinensis TaxID=3198878 RepID=UPI003158702E